MTSIALNEHPEHAASKGSWLTPWQAWGLILIAPYVLVFIFFVIYPVVLRLLDRAPSRTAMWSCSTIRFSRARPSTR